MKKHYFLGIVLMILASISTGKAQTYSLNELSENDFEAGGGTYWSFEKYDVATGVYSPFTTYGDSGRVNYFDRYNPERYASYPIMSNPEVLSDPYPIKRNSWFNDKNEYLYVGRDYPEGTANVDLEYWTTIPATLNGYEVYSAPAAAGGAFRNSAITFAVPATGYYKIDMSVLREDNIRVEPMNIIQRYRYGGETTVPDVSRINHGFSYGAGGTTAEDPTIVIPLAPENPAVGLVRYAAQTVTSNFFYIYAKAGDKISFETDARNVYMNNNVRDVWARTKWTNLALSVVEETTAKADLAKFVDPYSEDQAAFEELNALLEQAEELIGNHNSNLYPLSAKNALETVYVAIDNAYSSIHAMEISGFVERLQTAINNYLASAYGLKVRYIFDNVTGTSVPDASGSNNNGTIHNQASILKLGKYNVLNLGTGTGYLDMGTSVGNVVPNMGNYTVSAYYRVDDTEALSGNGHFLWTFSTQAANSATAGQYMYYRVPNQKAVIASAGWNSEKPVGGTTTAAKGSWQHIVYRQEGTTATLYVNGVAIATADEIPQPLGLVTTPTLCNWIGRPAFSSDNYLKNTFVYDFRLYNQAVPVDSITKWATLVPELDHETLYGEVGSFTELTSLINQYLSFLSSVAIGDGVGQYPEGAKYDLEDAIAIAQIFLNAGQGSQFLIDEKVKALKTAYDTFCATVGFALVYPASAGETQYPFESGLYYIEVGNYYLTVPETGTTNTYMELRPYILNEEKNKNNQVWNIQYNPIYSDLTLDPQRALYSFVSDKTIWTAEDGDGKWHMDEVGRMKEGNTVVTQSETGSNWDWREHRIYFNGTAYSLVNNHNNNALVFANATENEKAQSLATKKFNFIFRTIDDVVANPNQSNAIKNPAVSNQAKIWSANQEIIVSQTAKGDKITIYDISGRMIKTVAANAVENRIGITSGLYIVRVSGQTSVVAKVIVR
ncbi:MAG: hypothetical protein EZS26_000932 [Candidatus Ordinivivax streblomastigis]|uniref:T9SS C-terminal target domain-containing protein n=1 Tax=Candidatus Ordinivivax streblomastigis TaxID=2540710 RepID=A0A5M8P342_9BACT|nr:MAG: hypothetical protein EZS26_000932 [Candidatus Ordinivivax streblomastigis]